MAPDTRSKAKLVAGKKWLRFLGLAGLIFGYQRFKKRELRILSLFVIGMLDQKCKGETPYHVRELKAAAKVLIVAWFDDIL